MADIVLPAVQLSEMAWRNIAVALRETADGHLNACADVIEERMRVIHETFDGEEGRVVFKVIATFKPELVVE